MTISLQKNWWKWRQWQEYWIQIKKTKAIKQELGCQLIRIDHGKEDFDILKTINEIFRHIKQSTDKALISKISTRLLRLEFKSDNITKSKSKAIKSKTKL